MRRLAVATVLAALVASPALARDGDTLRATPAAWTGAAADVAIRPVQYYTPPPPYAYRKYYAYRNNTGGHRTARRSYRRVHRRRR